MIWNIECAEFWLRFIPMFSLLRRGHESRNVLHHGLQCFLHECGNCRWALARDTWIFGRGRWGEWLLMLRWTGFQLLFLGMFSCSHVFLGRKRLFSWEKQPPPRTPPKKWSFPNHFQESWKTAQSVVPNILKRLRVSGHWMSLSWEFPPMPALPGNKALWRG